jgi:hypothetical protein
VGAPAGGAGATPVPPRQATLAIVVLAPEGHLLVIVEAVDGPPHGELHAGRRRRRGHGLGPLHGGVEIDHGRRRRRGRGPGLRVGEHHAGRRRRRGRGV